MTAPRQVLPGRSYLITRRCTQRQFLLRPCTLTNSVLEYCFAVASERTGVDLHALCVLSNHYHAVVSDPCGRLPEFLELVHKLTAKALNAAMGRWENFWSSEKTSVVQLLTAHDVLEKMAYVLANPVAAGLVKSPCQWPGVITQRIGEHRSVEMPGIFFDDEGLLPHEVELSFPRPDIFLDLDDRELNRLLHDTVTQHVRRAREAIAQRGQAFLGVDAVLRQSQTAIPNTKEPRRNLSPRVACASKGPRVRALQALKDFLAAYRAAWLAWRDGDREVCFPVGTYSLCVHQGARCQAAVPT